MIEAKCYKLFTESYAMIWKKLKRKADKEKRPVFVLAPMADVTDSAFRQLVYKYSKKLAKESVLDAMWTEFVSCNGLADKKGKKILIKDLEFTKKEKPLIAQVFGDNPETYFKAAKLVQKMGFDGIDINMGCPVKKIVKQCSGSDLIQNPILAKEVIRAVKKGAPYIAVSVKTRIGYNKNEIERWIPQILEEDIDLLTIHGRTRAEMSKVPAHWDIIKRVVEIRDEMGVDTLIFGNGDIESVQDGIRKAKESGVDGIMIGRGIFGKLDLFDKRRREWNKEKKLKILLEHSKLFEKMYGKGTNKSNQSTRFKSFNVMKKHYKAYINGFDGAKELRIKLMDAESLEDVKKIVKENL